MNLQSYLQNRQKLIDQEKVYRKLCVTCLHPEFSCYCRHVEKFNPQIEFVILIHPLETRRRIATGRMSHLILEKSHLIVGQNYSFNKQVNAIIENPENQCVVLYPGNKSINLTHLKNQERSTLFKIQKKLVIFVIDGTWATAYKMIHQSQNLFNLPRICFTPPAPSRFRVRKQPAPGCYSTIEAIHHVIELIGPESLVQSRQHDKLIYVFDQMVEQQLKFREGKWALFFPKMNNHCR